MLQAQAVRHRRAPPLYNPKELHRNDEQKSREDQRRKKKPLSPPNPKAAGIALCLMAVIIVAASQTRVSMVRPSSVSAAAATASRKVTTVYFQSERQSDNLTMQEIPYIDGSQPYLSLPIDIKDPYLPWIHDYFVTEDATQVRFVAQNRRRCETGKGKQDTMKYWEPQVALFQAVPVKRDGNSDRLTLTSPEEATNPETRFVCRFHDADSIVKVIALSQYPFNYEYVNWRKRGDQPMLKKQGPDVEIFDHATLLFSCPIPTSFRSKPTAWLDLIPIRASVRFDEGYLLTEDQVGPAEFRKLHRFNTTLHYGGDNVPIPELDSLASYQRRGKEGSTVGDASSRLFEWLLFNRNVGYEHVYVYDNTQLAAETGQSYKEHDDPPLKAVTDLFPGNFVTYIRWAAPVCNNNFIGGRNPGERSSQYAAEASCRERFGPSSTWMSFMDLDEYLIPMAGDGTWGPLLETKLSIAPILGMKSTRARPRAELMDEVVPESNDGMRICGGSSSCLVQRHNETYLHTYNCDVRPKPPRSFTNMKQIYQPEFVLSHFVHYSVITKGIAAYYKDKDDQSRFSRKPSAHEKGLAFLDEFREGTMLHARSVLPQETNNRDTACRLRSNETCLVGLACPDSTIYESKLDDKNLFIDNEGNYCNCWINSHVESKLVPELERELERVCASKDKVTSVCRRS